MSNNGTDNSDPDSDVAIRVSGGYINVYGEFVRAGAEPDQPNACCNSPPKLVSTESPKLTMPSRGMTSEEIGKIRARLLEWHQKNDPDTPKSEL